ncbi:MAG: PH domain-containing protein [Coriobacteriia bacterium]|nr:PH domain-containing protein [Coriobacteriia bacterium]MCL2750733.1 PH domain-containing protein [Coriobacteriia bacterium]
MVLFFWILSIIGTCINYGGYTARRRGSRIEVEYGIIQHRFDGVDIDRVQSVIIKQSFLRKLIGYCEVSLGKIDALTDVQKQNNTQGAVVQRGLMVHPFVKKSRVPEILAGLVPEFADVPQDVIKLPKVSLRRALIRRCIVLGSGFWFAVTVAIVQVILNLALSDDPDTLTALNVIAVVLYLICALILVFDAIGAVLWYRRSGFAYNRNFMQIANSGFSFESVSFPRKKIQFGYIKSNPFQRLSKVMTITARTAAGIAGTNVRLLDVHEADAQVWLSWLEPRRRT